MVQHSQFDTFDISPQELIIPELSFGRQMLLKEMEDLLPRELLNEIYNFKFNNCLAVTYSEQGLSEMHCCQQCMKAHVFKIAEELEIDRMLMLYLDAIFVGRSGHEGYYMNGEELVKI